MIDERHRSKRGRKPIPEDEKRNRTVSVRLSDAEYALVDKKRGRLRLGEWMRGASLDRLQPTVPKINRQTYQELNRLSANVNQLAKESNLGRPIDLLEFRELILKVRLALLGADMHSNDEESS